MGLITHLNAALAAVAPDARLFVAYSGGLDSTCLLHLAANWAAQHGRDLTALHLNHGLSANAGAWQVACERQCERLGVELLVKQASFAGDQSGNLEQRARDIRYTWFESRLDEGAVLLMAHHQEDQAETLVLRMLRGSGTRGLSAIPESRPLGRGHILRPLLGFPRQALLDYAARQALEWIEDESNLSLDFDRNYLRHQILPRLASRWPGVVQQFARVAAHLREERELLRELAAEDARRLQRDEHSSLLDTLPPLDLSGFRALSSGRQRNTLQYLVQQVAVHPLSMERQREWLRQVGMASETSRARLQHESLLLAVHRDHLHFLNADLERAVHAQPLDWSSDQVLPLPTLGLVLKLGEPRAEVCPEALSFKPGDRLRVHWRQGGERVILPGESFSRSLKKLLQEKQVAPWLRRSMPLVSCGEQVVWSAVLGDLSPRLVDADGRCYSFELSDPEAAK